MIILVFVPFFYERRFFFFVSLLPIIFQTVLQCHSYRLQFFSKFVYPIVFQNNVVHFLFPFFLIVAKLFLFMMVNKHRYVVRNSLLDWDRKVLIHIISDNSVMIFIIFLNFLQLVQILFDPLNILNYSLNFTHFLDLLAHLIFYNF